LVIVGNKIDLHAQRQVQTSEGEALAAEWKCGFVEVSAKLNQHINKIFDIVLDEIEKQSGESSSSKSECVLL
jgi:Ras family protein